jgi:hypothetical protein
VPEGDERVVVHRGVAGAAAVELRVHALDGPEQGDGLVDEVRAEVVEHPGALRGAARLLPPGARRRAPAVEARLEAEHGA